MSYIYDPMLPAINIGISIALANLNLSTLVVGTPQGVNGNLSPQTCTLFILTV